MLFIHLVTNYEYNIQGLFPGGEAAGDQIFQEFIRN